MNIRPLLAVPAAIALAACATLAMAQDPAPAKAAPKSAPVAAEPAPAKAAVKPAATTGSKSVAEREGQAPASPHGSPAEDRKFKSCSDHASDA